METSVESIVVKLEAACSFGVGNHLGSFGAAAATWQRSFPSMICLYSFSISILSAY